MEPRPVGIFRNQLFKYSEPFITQQAQALRAFRPLYIGRECLGAGPDEAQSISLVTPGERHVARKAWNALTLETAGYRRRLKARSLALVHAHFGIDALYALPLARQLEVPLVTTFHGFDATTRTIDLWRSRSPAWMHYAVGRRRLARQGDLFLCVSNYIRKQVLAQGFPADRVKTHYIGVDTDNIEPLAAPGKSLRVLHVARLVEKKGTRYLIQAFARVVRHIPGAVLEIVGDGPLQSELSGLVRQMRLESCVSFSGRLPHADVMQQLKTTAVLALPSVRASTGDAEGLGMVLLEAAAMGVPLLGSNHGGIPEIVLPEQTGYLAEERDIESLAAYLRILLESSERRQWMGANARRHVETTFNLRCQTSILEAYYEEVVKNAN